MQINLIYARDRNGVMGKDGALPWHIPEDLAHFKRTTQGRPVIMGRRTWESLRPPFRPLPNRRNIVMTRQTGWHTAGVEVVHSWPQACESCASDDVVWVIGGAEVLAQAMPLAHRAVVTEIDATFDGDVWAAPLDAEWIEMAREEHLSAQGLAFCVVTFQRQR